MVALAAALAAALAWRLASLTQSEPGWAVEGGNTGSGRVSRIRACVRADAWQS